GEQRGQQQRLVARGDGEQPPAAGAEELGDHVEPDRRPPVVRTEGDGGEPEADEALVEARERHVAGRGVEQGAPVDAGGEHRVEGGGEVSGRDVAAHGASVSPSSWRATTLRWISLVPE